MYGDEPSEPARHAAGTVLDLGAGHGRDSLHFTRRGFAVHAVDSSRDGLARLRAQADREGLSDRITATVHDPTPLPDAKPR
ncbi:methyltransferase domain-containing protein [Saccharopolyspora hirsuta]|uniref:Methyltransferase domain-containing protein n=1 Tax=Saccharopolyspora hirsuta TaxID=1837 RepID=A0A5M7C9F1_SACHI|nr:methyltransferase domain-containing protein [Saccharopolyspora hirsuta]KAA5834945.1 methyltransferase domain-containing protein [Saccharopolyspora hirsuta]